MFGFSRCSVQTFSLFTANRASQTSLLGHIESWQYPFPGPLTLGAILQLPLPEQRFCPWELVTQGPVNGFTEGVTCAIRTVDDEITIRECSDKK